MRLSRPIPFAATIALALALTAPAAAQTADAIGATDDGAVEVEAQAMADFIEGYYRNPRPTQAINRLVDLDIDVFIQSERAAAEAQGLAILSTFMAHVLHAHPELAPVLAGRLAALGRADNALVAAHAIVTADIASATEALAVLSEAGLLDAATRAELAGAPRYPFPRLRASSHFDIDLFWTSFFATGNPLYIDRVAAALTYWEDDALERLPREYPALSEESRQLAIIQVTMAVVAHGTLSRNARRHPAVLAALDALAASRADKVGVIAGSIAATVRAGG